MSSVPIIRSSTNLDEMRDVISRICRDYLTGAWKTISADDLQLKRISGGLSNFLYYVSLPENFENNNSNNSNDDICNNTIQNAAQTIMSKKIKRQRNDSYSNCLPEPKEVLLRIYGQTHGEQALETVLTDTVVFTLLSERKLGPQLHGIFPGGRIEQYIPARALKTTELSDMKISHKIAQKMAEIHSLNIPVSKEPEWLWKTMDRWLINIEQNLKQLLSEQKQRNNKNMENDERLCTTELDEMECAKKMNKIDFRNEVNWLKMLIDNEDCPVVFSHNDLQEGNILLKDKNFKKYMEEEDEQLSSIINNNNNNNNNNNKNNNNNNNNNNDDDDVNDEDGIVIDDSDDNVDIDDNINNNNNNNNNTLELDSHFDSIIISNDINNKKNCNNDDEDDNDNQFNNHRTLYARKRSLSLNNDSDFINDSSCSSNNSIDSIKSLPTACSSILDDDDDDDDINNNNNINNNINNNNNNNTNNNNNSNDEPELMIIDFEYCAYNYRGFDFANHFLEWTMDYTNNEFPYFYHKQNQYPTKEQQELFIKTYLHHLSSDLPINSMEIDEILNEIKYFTLVSHLFWTLWSLVNVHQDIKFGYWDYANCRIQEYFTAKEEYQKFKGLKLKRKHTLDDRK